MLIVDLVPEEIGWTPIQYMAVLAAELLDTHVVRLDRRAPSAARKALSIIFRRTQSRVAQGSCLMICSEPKDLLNVIDIPQWRKRFKFLAAWIIDSFWHERIPATLLLTRPFDHLFVTSKDDVDAWQSISATPATWLPWGADALRLGRGACDREWDVTRVGRQPPEWDDDAATTSAAARLGIKYRGRPNREGVSPLQNSTALMTAYGSSKYIMAFSNSVNRATYTHPIREYLTGRWADALACGAIVAGIAPRGAGGDALLWPGATLELGTVRRDAGLRLLAEDLKKWRPEKAALNHAMALKTLDWRWRFKVIADTFGETPAPLAHELNLLRERLPTVLGESTSTA